MLLKRKDNASTSSARTVLNGESLSSNFGINRIMTDEISSKQLLIVWHSLTGGTEAMVAAARGGAAPECRVVAKRAVETRPEDMFAADAFLFACPENLASMAGLMKDFFDRCYYPMLGQIEGRAYAVMICAGTDGEGAARQIARIATGWRLKAVAEPLIICTHAQTAEEILAPKLLSPSDRQRCTDLARALGAGLALGIF
jgi:flavodoxin